MSAEILDALTKMSLAFLLSGLLGLERERKNRAAGLRTHIIVCLGSTLAMIASSRLAGEWDASPHSMPFDRGRIAAGILQGIGFIGAGAIINTGNIHRGLTTAAMIWFVGVLGIAVGLGYYLIAIGATAFALVAVLLLERVSAFMSSTSDMTLSFGYRGEGNILRDVEAYLKTEKFFVTTSKLRQQGDTHEITLELKSPGDMEIDDLVRQLRDQFNGIQQISVER